MKVRSLHHGKLIMGVPLPPHLQWLLGPGQQGAWHPSFYPRNLLLHHEDDLLGVVGVVEDGDAEASPGRLDFLTVGE